MERITNYDSKNDILYISSNKNRPAISEEPIDGILIRRAVDNNEIIGVTIFDIKKIFVIEKEKIMNEIELSEKKEKFIELDTSQKEKEFKKAEQKVMEDMVKLSAVLKY